jgi:hypothetical protein
MSKVLTKKNSTKEQRRAQIVANTERKIASMPQRKKRVRVRNRRIGSTKSDRQMVVYKPPPRTAENPFRQVHSKQMANALAYVSSVCDPWDGPAVRIPDRGNQATGLVPQFKQFTLASTLDSNGIDYYWGIQVKPDNKEWYRVILSVALGVITWGPWIECPSQSTFEAQFKQIRTVNTGLTLMNVSNIQTRHGTWYLNNSMVGENYEDELSEIGSDSRTKIDDCATHPDVKLIWKPATYQYGTVESATPASNIGGMIWRIPSYTVTQDNVITVLWAGLSAQEFTMTARSLFEHIPLANFSLLYNLKVSIPADSEMDDIWSYVYGHEGISVGSFRQLGISENSTTWWGSLINKVDSMVPELRTLVRRGIGKLATYYMGGAGAAANYALTDRLTMKFHYLAQIRDLPSESPLHETSFYRKHKVECKTIEDFDKFLQVRAALIEKHRQLKNDELVEFENEQRKELEEGMAKATTSLSSGWLSLKR